MKKIIIYSNRATDHPETIKLKSKLECAKGEVKVYEFWFQGKRYPLSLALVMLEDNGMKITEIFPGIYIRPVNSIKNKIKLLINNLMKPLDYEVDIICRNERDDFIICIDQAPSSIFDDEEDTHETSMIEERVDILPSKIEHKPWASMGGGACGGCPVLGLFERRGLLRYRDENYRICSAGELLKATIGHEEIENICKTSKCYETYLSIKKSGYQEGTRENFRDRIYGYLDDGVYFVEEGKHRVCAMKRFGYDLPIPFYYVRYTKNKIFINRYSRLHETTKHMENLVKDCYESFGRLGIEKNAVRRFLKAGSISIVDFLKQEGRWINIINEDDR